MAPSHHHAPVPLSGKGRGLQGRGIQGLQTGIQAGSVAGNPLCRSRDRLWPHCHWQPCPGRQELSLFYLLLPPSLDPVSNHLVLLYSQPVVQLHALRGHGGLGGAQLCSSSSQWDLQAACPTWLTCSCTAQLIARLLPDRQFPALWTPQGHPLYVPEHYLGAVAVQSPQPQVALLEKGVSKGTQRQRVAQGTRIQALLPGASCSAACSVPVSTHRLPHQQWTLSCGKTCPTRDPGCGVPAHGASCSSPCGCSGQGVTHRAACPALGGAHWGTLGRNGANYNRGSAAPALTGPSVPWWGRIRDNIGTRWGHEGLAKHDERIPAQVSVALRCRAGDARSSPQEPGTAQPRRGARRRSGEIPSKAEGRCAPGLSREPGGSGARRRLSAAEERTPPGAGRTAPRQDTPPPDTPRPPAPLTCSLAGTPGGGPLPALPPHAAAHGGGSPSAAAARAARHGAGPAPRRTRPRGPASCDRTARLRTPEPPHSQSQPSPRPASPGAHVTAPSRPRLPAAAPRGAPPTCARPLLPALLSLPRRRTPTLAPPPGVPPFPGVGGDEMRKGR